MPDHYPRFKAAAVQAAPVFLNREATVAKACQLIQEAVDNGAQLIVFPETYIPTYPFWPKEHRETSRRVFVELFKNAVEIPSSHTDALCETARKAGAYVVMGLNERDRDYGGSLYNTLLYIGKDGQIMDKHRKLIPTWGERMVWGQGDGSGLKVFDTDIGRLGGLICAEHHMPLARYAMFAKGEQVHAAVWPASRFMNQVIDATCRSYAFEGQAFVIVSCSHITKDMVPDSFELKEQVTWEVNGGSAIINPLGEYLAGPLYDREGILYADIDLELVIRAKAVIDVVGHYARPDVLRLWLNEEKQEPFTNTSKSFERSENQVYQELATAVKELVSQVDQFSEAELRKAVEGLGRKLRNN